jgi:hypothetical protein
MSAWIESAARLPQIADATQEGLVWVWTDPDGDTPQTSPYNSAHIEDVARYPFVYVYWMAIVEVTKT